MRGFLEAFYTLDVGNKLQLLALAVICILILALIFVLSMVKKIKSKG